MRPRKGICDMCGIYGMFDYGELLARKDIKSLICELGEASAVRGTDATGLAFLHKNKIEIVKQAKSAYDFRFDIPKGVHAIIGHTRHATQGKASTMINNHPFAGKTVERSFAFAHNGIIHNDRELRKSQHLPNTKIETDSYIAVQLLNQNAHLDLNSIKQMTELIEGSYSFEILDTLGNLYLVKGSSPISILHDKKLKVYIYASTDQILWHSIVNSSISAEFRNRLLEGSKDIEEIEINQGEILQISSDGSLEHMPFKMKEDYSFLNWRYGSAYPLSTYGMTDENHPLYGNYDEEYIDSLKYVALQMGHDENIIDIMVGEGFSLDEIEEYLYTEEPKDDRLLDVLG